jgi:protein TonB
MGVLGEGGPEVLTGPLPVYPELLRQAGIQGRVVLEAIVDSGGRVVPGSIAVVSATNPAFVAPARQALLATLFRPALVGGRMVAVHVRIPYDFTIRAGQSLWTSP